MVPGEPHMSVHVDCNTKRLGGRLHSPHAPLKQQDAGVAHQQAVEPRRQVLSPQVDQPLRLQ
jgi:hypothetical protein